MQVNVQIVGDLNAMMASEVRAGERAVTAAIRQSAAGLKTRWRTQVTGAGLGSRLANTIRSKTYPQGQQSLNAAAVVWSKAPHIIAAHDEGPTITSRDGFWLAIPTKAAGKSRRGGRITPLEWEEKTGRRLRFVYWGGRIAKLVDDGAASFRKVADPLSFTQSRAGQRRRKKARLIFILVPRVKLAKRLNLSGEANAVAASLPAAILSAWRGATPT